MKAIVEIHPHEGGKLCGKCRGLGWEPGPGGCRFSFYDEDADEFFLAAGHDSCLAATRCLIAGHWDVKFPLPCRKNYLLSACVGCMFAVYK